MTFAQLKERNRKYRLWLIVPSLLGLSALCLTFASGCGHEKANAKVEGTAEPALEVSTTTPKLQTLRRLILQPGIVKSYEETPIYSKIAGFFRVIHVDIGDKVKKGQVLAELRVPEVEEDVRAKEAKVVEAEADVKQAQKKFAAAQENVNAWMSKVKERVAGVAKAQSEVDRWAEELKRDKKIGVDPKNPESEFFSKKTIAEVEHQLTASKALWQESKSKVLSAEASLDESKAKCKQAEAEIEVCEARLAVRKAEYEEEKAWFAYANITAPFDGIVTRRIAHTEHFVQPANSGTTSKSAEPLFVVMRTDRMRVVVQVPEYDAPLVKDGAEAIFRPQAYRGSGGLEIKCKVTRTSWALDNDAKTLRVEFFIDNPGCELTDPVFAALRKANVPETVLAKLTPLKDKQFMRKEFAPQLAKLLNAGELKDWETPIVSQATYPKDDLTPGMYGNATIVAELPNTLCLPAEAVLTDGNKNYCFMIEDGKARRVNVRVGISNRALTEVMEKQLPPTKIGDEGAWVNFAGNEKVITSNLKSLQDGQPVKQK